MMIPTDKMSGLSKFEQEDFMTLGTLLLIVLVLVLVGAIPAWPHSRSWGYMPSGVISLLFIVLIVMLLTGRI